MNTITNMGNVIDSRDIIARIEELEGDKVEQWIAGYNMAGYMPDSEPSVFEDFDDAKEYILNTLEDYIDDEAEGNPESARIPLWQQMYENIKTADEGEFSFVGGGMCFFVSQGDDILTDADDAEELRILTELADECEGYASDWNYGEALIRRSYFEQYMDEIVADCYTMPKDMPSWMSIVLDYVALEQDYAIVDFDGVEYLIRSI